jgi:hypothetical protein
VELAFELFNGLRPATKPVSNHDVLAESFTETKIAQTNSDYEKIKTPNY